MRMQRPPPSTYSWLRRPFGSPVTKISKQFVNSSATAFRLAIFAIVLIGCRDGEPAGPDLSAITISPDSALLLTGDSVLVHAEVHDRDGNPDLQATVTWQSSDPAIVAVANGRIIAHGIGTAMITASNGVRAATMKVRVVGVADCSATGVTHTGAIDTATWRAIDSPHLIADTVRIRGRVTIEAGAVVCGLPGAAILVTGPAGVLTAAGTLERPVRMTAKNAGQRWAGIRVGGLFGEPEGGSASLQFTKLEFGNLMVGYRTHATIDNSRFQNASVWAGDNFAILEMRNSVVDSGNVLIASGTLEDNVIRAGGLTVARPQSGSVTLGYNRIEDSPQTAFTVQTRGEIPPTVTVTKSLRITGSRGAPVSIPIDLFTSLWPTGAAQDSLLGNANDTLIVWYAPVVRDVYVRRELPWKVICAGAPCFELQVDDLTLEAGAHLRTALNLRVLGGVTATGTAQNPITVSSANPSTSATSAGLRVSAGATSTLAHVHLNNISLLADSQRVVHLQRVRSNASIEIRAGGSTIADAELDDVGPHQSILFSGALVLGGAGIHAERIIVRRTHGSAGTSFNPNAVPIAGIALNASDIHIDDCDVNDNEHDGIRVMSGANVQIHGCNLERNGGSGVVNLASPVVDAQRNWWGDPAGPEGPAGDGISGNVDATDPLTSPRTALAVPASITISATRETLGTADTVRLSSTVRDSGGNVVGADLVWRVSDASIAMLDSLSPKLLVGKRAGTTTITALVASDTMVRASITIDVTPAAPVYNWTREPTPMISPRAVWGSALDDIYYAGYPALLHNDGNGWAVVQGGPTSTVHQISGTSSTSVFFSAASNGATEAEFWHWNGSAWLLSTPPAPIEHFVAIGPNEAIVLTNLYDPDSGHRDLSVYRYLDGTWSRLFTPLQVGGDLLIWARSATDIYVGGSSLQHWDGQTVSPVADVASITGSITAMTGTNGYVYFMTSVYDGTTGYVSRAYRYDGSHVENLAFATHHRVVDLYAVSDHEIVAVGDGVSFFDGQRWWPVSTGTTDGFRGAWIFGDDIYIGAGRFNAAGAAEAFLVHGRKAP
jgi:hypothetical protein